MSIKKKISFSFSFLFALFLLLHLINVRVVRELQRYCGFMEDKYISVGLEETISNVETWTEAEEYLLSHLRFDNNQNSVNSEIIHNTGKSVCFGSAMLAKKLLSDNKNRYEVSLYLFKNRKGNWSHMFALVQDKETEKFGSLGINASDCITPKYTKKEYVFRKIRNKFFWKMYGTPEEISFF